MARKRVVILERSCGLLHVGLAVCTAALSPVLTDTFGSLRPVLLGIEATCGVGGVLLLVAPFAKGRWWGGPVGFLGALGGGLGSLGAALVSWFLLLAGLIVTFAMAVAFAAPVARIVVIAAIVLAVILGLVALIPPLLAAATAIASLVETRQSPDCTKSIASHENPRTTTRRSPSRTTNDGQNVYQPPAGDVP